MNRAGILAQLFSSYPNSNATEETVAMYDRLTADIPDEALQTVVYQAITTSKFLPTIAELREAWLAATQPAGRTWVEAWDEVQTQMRKVGYIGTPKFSDEVTTSIVKSMGWRALCGSENVAVDRAQFRDMYNAMMTRTETDKRTLPGTKALQIGYAGNGVKHLTGD